jgi:hypothetical protein
MPDKNKNEIKEVYFIFLESGRIAGGRVRAFVVFHGSGLSSPETQQSGNMAAAPKQGVFALGTESGEGLVAPQKTTPLIPETCRENNRSNPEAGAKAQENVSAKMQDGRKTGT